MMSSRHLGMVYLFFIAIIGIIFGTVYIQLQPHAVISELLEQWGTVFDKNHTINGTNDVLWSYYLFQCQYLIIMFLLGLSIIGYPIMLVLYFVKAFIIGASIQLFITLWGDHAWTYIMVWILPSACLVLLATILCCTAMGQFCGSFFILLLKTKRWDNPLRKLVKPTLIAMFILLLAAVTQTYLSPFVFQNLIL